MGGGLATKRTSFTPSKQFKTYALSSKYLITFRPAFILFRACYFAINPNLITFARLKANNIMNLSVIEHSNNTKQRRLAYVPARIKVIHINAQRVICQSGSGGNSSLGETMLDENNFEQL